MGRQPADTPAAFCADSSIRTHLGAVVSDIGAHFFGLVIDARDGDVDMHDAGIRILRADRQFRNRNEAPFRGVVVCLDRNVRTFPEKI